MAEASFPVKRVHPRFAFFADGEVTLGDGTSVPVQLCELSSRGCYVGALEPIPVGTGVLLRIRSDKGTCELRAKVIYLHSSDSPGTFGMGVVFDKMSAEQRSTIETWLHELADKPA